MSSIGESVGSGGLPEVFGRYRIKKRLARGGMGTVYLAHDTTLDREVALKVPLIDTGDRDAWLARFYREARAAAALRHPNLCPVYDVGEIDGTPYLSMAYIEGSSLAHFVGRAHAGRTCTVLIRKIALALAEAHRHGVLHRDLKPANIMIDQRQEPIVMDFGLARRGDSDDARLTRNGEMLGTPAYMPPEQVLGKIDAMGPACDIYSLGVILYELLCGKPPFEGPTAVVIGQILGADPTPPSQRQPGVDRALEAICLKAMAKRAERRYASMDDFAATLNEYLRTTPQSPTAQSATATSAPMMAASAAPAAGAPTILPQFAAAPLMPTSVGTNVPPYGSTATGYGQATSPDLPRNSAWLHRGWPLVAVMACAVVILLVGALLLSAGRDDEPPDAPKPDGQVAAKADQKTKGAAPPVSRKTTGSLAISAGHTVSLGPGERATLEVHVERKECQGAIEILWSGLPPSVAADGAVVPAGESDAKLKLIAADDAEPASATAVLSASLGSLQATANIRVVVGSPKAADPPAAKPAASDQNVPPAAAGDRPAAAPPAGMPKEFTNPIGLKLVLVPSGKFMMGSGESMQQLDRSFGKLPSEFQFANTNEQPAHSVSITKHFYMGAYEVTRDQFARFVDANNCLTDAEKRPEGGSGWNEGVHNFVQDPDFTWRNAGFEQTGEHPVVNVSWQDAMEFCAWLSKEEGKQYRLPTEAEWEYACRAGTETRFYNGDGINSLVKIANVADQRAQLKLGSLFYVHAIDGFAFTAPTGRFQPNAFGLYDMIGNVWEWCSDWYDPAYYGNSPTEDPQGPAAGLLRVARGGSFNDPPVYERCARRGCLAPSNCYCGQGFRVVCEAGPAQAAN